jgi:hypothetical protein
LRNPSLTSGRSDDGRVLGDDRFMATLKRPWRPRDQHAVEPADLRSPGRRRKAAIVRAPVVHHALERRIATMSALARHFGRSASTLCETLERYRRSRPELFRSPLDRP